ncbi:MAG: sigma-70 family RNA polymerase sigma factor [Oscillospiraceae bacterium]|nr:sigma-70 family RNA polymerase sigma factor [Oscillospiraceae bacterium]
MNNEQHQFLEDLVLTHERSMAALATRLTGDDHLAKDLVQEVFLVAISKVDKLIFHPNPRGWLYTTLYHIVSREMSLARHALEFFPDEETRPFEIPFFDPGFKLREIIPAELSETDREVLIDRFEEQLEYEEMAEKYGITENACRLRLFRAIKRCREAMEREDRGESGKAGIPEKAGRTGVGKVGEPIELRRPGTSGKTGKTDRSKNKKYFLEG